MALSNNETQQEMRLKALSLLDMNRELSTVDFHAAGPSTSSPLVMGQSVTLEEKRTSQVSMSNPHRIKRYVMTYNGRKKTPESVLDRY
jgi:hypothetical protein